MNVKQLRSRSGLTQDAFWNPIGISQSGGSRYESGTRRIPRPIQLLITIRTGSDHQAFMTYKRLRG